jgi:hypothetical protein
MINVDFKKLSIASYFTSAKNFSLFLFFTTLSVAMVVVAVSDRGVAHGVDAQ